MNPPPNFRMNEVWAYVAVDPAGNSEGIIGQVLEASGLFMPFVCGDQARIDSLRSKAIAIGKETNMTIKLVRFSTREEIEIFEP